MNNWKILLSLLVNVLMVTASQENSQNGRILFFAPYISKSIRFKALPLIQGLADRGHETVLMMPFCEDCGQYENITVLNMEKYDGEDPL